MTPKPPAPTPASRSLYQAHLTPIEAPAKDGTSAPGELEKFTRLRRLAVNRDSVETVVSAIREQVGNDQADAATKVLHRLAAESKGPAALRLAPTTAELQPDTITAITRVVLDLEGGDKGIHLLMWEGRLSAHPVGRLSLQRLDFVPSGIERGPLTYSLPLAPGEKTVVTHKEWATTESEFSELVSDELADYSERGVVEKTELADSTTTQQQHTFGMSASMTASGSYGPVSVSATAALNVGDASSRSSTDSRKHSEEVTRKAATRSLRRHQISFRTGRASGSEESSERSVTNPYQDRAARVDYYQLLRKWRVNLYEYDERLTYDVVVPEPGMAFLQRHQEIQDLRDRLAQDLAFPLQPTQLTRDDYHRIAALYGVAVDPPPLETKPISVTDTKTWPNAEASRVTEYHVLPVEIPEEYVVEEVAVHGQFAFWARDHQKTFSYPDQATLNSDILGRGWLGRTGTLQLVYLTYHLSTCYLQVEVRARLRPEAFAAWQTRTYNQIRDAALARHYAAQQTITDRIDELERRLGSQDALSLRKAEREELMRAALQWTIGPDFTFDLPDGVRVPIDASVPDDFTFAILQGRSEIIKFLHHAVEWENMNYFLYPYFWSADRSWPIRREVDHDDMVHKAFLRAGAARLVLPIRRGYETEFVSFVATGRLDGTSPYMSIAEEIRHDAETRYPEVPGTDPDESTRKATGTLMASWWQWTPTNAIDAAFTDTLPSM